MKTIIHTLHIHAPTHNVYEALTSRDGLRGWWTTKVDVEAGEGGIIRFTFHGDFHPHMRQESLQPGREVRWLCVDGHPNWKDNRFLFRLRENDGETELYFVQEYAAELADEVYGTYNFNWGYYLNSLKQLVESGKGSPFTPPDG